MFCLAGGGVLAYSPCVRNKVLGDTRSSNPAPLQSKMRERMSKGVEQMGWGGRVCSHTATEIALSLDLAVFPPHFTGHSVPPQHWVHGSAVFIQHRTSEVRKGSLQTTEAGRRGSGGSGLEPQGPTWTLVRGHSRKENGQPASVKDTLPAISSLGLPPWRASRKYGLISSLPCSFSISSLKEHEPSLKGNTQQIQKEIQIYNTMEKHSCLGL